MTFLIVKYLLTAAVIVAASEIAKRSDRLGALILALPLMTIITLIWLNFEKQPVDKIANHAYYTFWYVIPTLPMFLAFPFLLRKYGFSLALLISAIGTAILFGILAIILGRFGIRLI